MPEPSPAESTRPEPPVYLPEERSDFDVLYFYHVLRERLWIILVIMGVAFLAGLAIYLRLPRLYASTAVLQVEQFEQKVTNGMPFRQVNMMTLEYTQSLAKSMDNRGVYYRTVVAAGLDKDPRFAPPAKDGPAPASAASEDELSGAFAGKIKIELGQGTRLIEVTVLDEDPARAKQLVDTFIAEFLKDFYAKQLDVASTAESFLQAQALKLKAKLEESEQKLQRYKEENDAVSLEETQNITVQKLKDLNERVTTAKGERLKLESDLDALKKLRRDDYANILQIGSVSRLEDVAAARAKLDTAASDFDTVTKRYQYKHWRYIEAKGRVEQLTAALNATLGNAADILAKQYAASLTTEQKLTESLKEQEKQALELNRIAIPYNVLAREVESDRKIYDGVIDRIREMNVSETAKKAPFQIVQPPLVSAAPVSPKWTVIMVQALATGAVVCLLVIFTLESLNVGFRGVDEVEAVLETAVLAVVPRMSRQLRSEEKPRPLVLLEHPTSLVAEGFRTLCTALTLLGPKATHRVILVTSAIPSEGKSFCALNTAAAFALEGHRTLLIDADLRRPTLQAALLSGEKNPLGLSDVLAGVIEADKAIHTSTIDHLALMPAGRRAPNPPQLLGGEAFPAMLAALAAQYDHIIIDSAPINAVSDTLRIVQHAQKVCLVLRVDKTPRKAVMRAARLIRKAGGDIAGAVLNRATSNRSGGYYYYSYSYAEKDKAKA